MKIFKEEFSTKEIIILLILSFINFATIYNGTIFPVVYTKITKFYNTNFEISSLIFTAYLLVGTISISIFGKLTDKYNLKILTIIVIFFQLVACFFIRYSSSIWQIIGFSALMGIAMANFVINFAFIRLVFSEKKISIATGVFVAANSLAMVIGNYYGSMITKNYGWQTSYFLLTILVAILFIISAIYLPNISSEKKIEFDILGAIFYSLTLAFLLITLFFIKKIDVYKTIIIDNFVMLKKYYIFNNILYILIPLSLLTTFTFLIIIKKKKNPIIKLDILKDKRMLSLNIIGFLSAFSLFAIFALMSILYSNPIEPGFNLSVENIGKILALSAFFQIFSGFYSGKLIIKYGLFNVLKYSLYILTILNLVMIFSLNNFLLTTIIFIIITLFTNIIINVSLNLTQVFVKKEFYGIATGINMNSRGLAGAVSPIITSYILTKYTVMQNGFNYPKIFAFKIIFFIFTIFFLIASILAHKFIKKNNYY